MLRSYLLKKKVLKIQVNGESCEVFNGALAITSPLHPDHMTAHLLPSSSAVTSGGVDIINILFLSKCLTHIYSSISSSETRVSGYREMNLRLCYVPALFDSSKGFWLLLQVV